MLDERGHNNFSPTSVNHLASLLYFAEDVHRLAASGKIAANAPPVFILGYPHESRALSLPSAAELKSQGITQIVYLNQGDQFGGFNPEFQSRDRLAEDLTKAAMLWEKAGIKLLYTGVNPHPGIAER